MRRMYDAIIIGAGPVGSRVAYLLAEAGHRVGVIDKKTRLDEPVCCTGIISTECVKRFNIPGSVILRLASSARVFSPSGNELRLERPEPQACIVDRPAFNAAMAEQARRSGAEYILNSPVKSIDSQTSRVRIEIEREAGENEYLEAKIAVIASGSNSKLAPISEMGKYGDFAMGAQVEVESTNLDEVEIYFGHKIAPAFFAWLVPLSGKRALAGLLSRRRTGYYLKTLISTLKAEGKIVDVRNEISFAPVPLKPIARTYGHRVVVAGSAAGQVKPITGGGIYYGLICADIAGEHLHRAIESGNLSDRDLAGYEKQWKKTLGQEFKKAYIARKFFELLSDRRLDSAFNIIKSNGIDKTLLESPELEFDWHGGSILKLLGNRALEKTFGSIKFPPGPTGRERR
jgi:digeranylgeranylglycerophospholipid reductase